MKHAKVFIVAGTLVTMFVTLLVAKIYLEIALNDDWTYLYITLFMLVFFSLLFYITKRFVLYKLKKRGELL